MTTAKDTDDDYTSDFHLNDQSGYSNILSGKKDASVNLDNQHDGFLSAESSPETHPVRITNIFSKMPSFTSQFKNKRDKKADSAKVRSMSHDVSSQRLTCYCCGKEIGPPPYDRLTSDLMFSLCTRCSSALDKKQSYARTHNGTARVSPKSRNLVEFTCEKGHSWTVNINRTYKDWCSTCRKLQKEERKRQFKKKSQEYDRVKADRQKKIFDEAHDKAVEHSKLEATLQSGNYDFEDLFSSILPLAKDKADNFMSQEFTSALCTYEQALAVYKMLELDVNRVKFILEGINADSKKNGYKKLAMTLHPDKNRHPLSHEAFIKASELLNSSF